MGSALRYKNIPAPRHQSEQARLKVVQGPDQGVIFLLTSTRVSIGRGDENDVVLSDLKASRLHAEISLGKNSWQVRDLGSANGIQVNGKPVQSSDLKINDIITLGETTFEFFSSDAPLGVLMASPRALVEVKTEHSNFDARKAEVRALAGMGTAPSTSGQRKRGLLGVGAILILGVIWILSSPAPQKKNKTSHPSEEKRDLSSYLPPISSPNQDKTVERFFKSGFREFREKNYLRAKSHFETVLQIAPGHLLARLYLSHCEQSIQDEVKMHLERGRKGIEAGKIKEARGHFEAVLRLLYRDPQHPHYLEAKEHLNHIDLEKSKEGGEG